MNYTVDQDLTQAEYYMQECFDLAKNGLGRTSPNPIVGAIVLDKNGVPVGKGYHNKVGSEHAEVLAIREAGDKAQGGTLIVNLEPCCHQGRTPPCVDLIIKSKIQEVIFSNYDLNPLVNSKGEEILLKNNIRVISKVLEDEGKELNKFFFKWIKTKLPWVTLKQAQTLDGKVALRNRNSKWITEEAARKEAHCLRNYYDVILVGANTIETDNPELTVRNLENSRNPARVILDPKLITKPESKVYQPNAKVFLVTKNGHPREKINNYIKSNKEINVIELEEIKKDKVDLKQLVPELGKLGFLSILIEAGPVLASELFTENLIDEYILFISSKLFGDSQALPSVSWNSLENIEKAVNFRIFSHKTIGNDLMLSLRPI